MKHFLPLLFALIFLAKAMAQQPAEEQDSVLTFAEEMPRFPGCEIPDSSLAFRQKCAEAVLMDYMYRRLVYPKEAYEQGIEGTVVASFVVHTDGSLSDVKILRDIGGGCGEEVLNILKGMQEEGIRWRPGYHKGKPVPVRFNLPVRFKWVEPLPYALVQGDTIYTTIDSLPAFEGGMDALNDFLKENLRQPETAPDTCWLGDMNVEILIHPDGTVKILDVKDYNGLGFDYQFEAIRVATATTGHWRPAMYRGRAVPTSYMLYMLFEPKGEACKGLLEAYEEARRQSEEGLKLFNEGKKEEGLQLLNRAVAAFPHHANFRYTRAQMYINMKDYEKACEDLSVVRARIVLPTIEQLYPLICRRAE